MMMSRSVRVIDGGGNGFRRSDVRNGKPSVPVESKPFDSVEELIKFAITDLPADTLGISYAIAGVVKEGRIMVMSPNIKYFDNTPLADMTTAKTGKLVVVCNDMESSVVGMSLLVPEVRGERFIGITVSSGIGLRFADKNGWPIFSDCEGGHFQIDPSPNAPLCGCGNRGCVEAIAGGEAIRRRVLAETQVRGIKIPDGMHPCAFLDEADNRGEQWAMDINYIVLCGLGDLLAVLVSLSHIKHIVWKGTIAQKMIPRMAASILDHVSSKIINPAWARELEFHFSPSIDDINNSDSFVGAAQILRNQLGLKLY